MRAGLPAMLEDFRNILCVCPCCGDVVRLTDIPLSYQAEPRKSWLDDLESATRRQDEAEQRFDEQEERMRERARERAARQLPALLRKVDPIFSRRGYFPQDVKALFDPVEFIIFDGMNRKAKVGRVVFLDHEPDSKSRERIQDSIRHAIKAGNCAWRTVRLTETGVVEQDR